MNRETKIPAPSASEGPSLALRAGLTHPIAVSEVPDGTSAPAGLRLLFTLACNVRPGPLKRINRRGRRRLAPPSHPFVHEPRHREGEKPWPKALQHKLDRVRRPRVQITYDVETNGAMQKIELPFVVGVLADLSGQPKEPLKPLKDRKVVDHRPRQLQRRAGQGGARASP